MKPRAGLKMNNWRQDAAGIPPWRDETPARLTSMDSNDFQRFPINFEKL